MPTIELVPDDAPLAQGDILSGLKLYSTQRSWKEDGGSAGESKAALCLVVSRPCVVSHKKHLTVVAIDVLQNARPPNDDFEAAVTYLETLRDGEGAPDVFYLGGLPNKAGRFCARLDQFHDVEVPVESSQRQEFVRRCRVARLHTDFTRDLHSRLFGSFVSLGFNDYGWMCDDDLNWVIVQGQSQRSKFAAEKMRQSGFGGGAPIGEKKMAALMTQLEAFEAEGVRRQALQAPTKNPEGEQPK